MCILGKQTTLISYVPTTPTTSAFSETSLTHSCLSVLFCDLPRLTRAMYVTMKLPVGAWWLSRGQKTKDSGFPSRRID